MDLDLNTLIQQTDTREKVELARVLIVAALDDVCEYHGQLGLAAAMLDHIGNEKGRDG